ncbi:protein FAM161B-like [Ylistrum balloti]|uniref:protein FAM161B-like n=1 Tax=Ylistrum balloti TaxID=509963 RepID=UPI002905C98B|nr:protein FAM161B-like [Ylistrum balloti]
MATAHHSLAVLTNACVKPPVDPKTGLSASFNERTLASLIHYGDEYAEEKDEMFDDEGQTRGDYLPGLALSDPASKDIPRELNNLPDDKFYEKLIQLKSEHKKTLAICEKLYNRKINSDQGDNVNGFVSYADFGKVPVHLAKNEETYISEVNGVQPPEMFSRNSLNESASKPPTGRPAQSPGIRTVPSPGIRTLPVKRTTVPKERPSSAPTRSGSLNLARSLEEEVWLKIAAERKAAREAKEDEPVERYETTQSETYETPELTTALADIDDMWDNFSIEEYAPRAKRPSSATVTRKEKEKEWRHRITIPKPFKMTIREMNKEKKISQIQKEQEEKLQQKYKEEEMECQKKFKASPVPAHIYLPMYDEIAEKNETRRRYIQEYSKELLKSQERPFNFMKREEDKKKHRRVKSAPISDDNVRKSTSFKAKPVPTSVIDNSVNDKIMEEEEYRKIRIKMRSEELLKAATLPPNMEARKQYEQIKKRDKQVKNKRKAQFQPKVNHEVPDYDELYRHFQKELARRKRERESTVVKPFQLNTMHLKSTQDRIIKDIERDEENMKENRWPYKNPRVTPRSLGTLSTSLDSIPAKNTVSADLRNNHTRKKLHNMTNKEREQLEADRKRRIREMRLRTQIMSKTRDGENGRTLEDTYRQKVRTFKNDDRARKEEYQKSLEEMQARVNKRPLLFQQESQVNARASAEKKFASTLRNYGIDEDFVQSRSSRAASVVNDDGNENYEDDFDATYAKSVDDEKYDDYDDDEVDEA